MFKRGTLIITFVLIFMLFAGQPAVSADEDVSLLDNLELYGGPLYTRPAMTEFMDYFEELEVGFQEYFELIEAFIELDYELGEIEDYDFADSYDIPEGPVGALGFYGGLAAENEQGIRAATGFERFYMDFSGSADYEVWVDLGEDQGEIEEEVEISQEIDMTVNSIQAEFGIPLLLEAESDLEGLLQHMRFTAGGGYYWGSGEMHTAGNRETQITDPEGETEKESVEEEEEQDIEADGNFGFNAGLGFSAPVDQNLTVFADVMYRYLELDMEIDEAAISENETEVLQEDMSGWKFRAGLGYQF